MRYPPVSGTCGGSDLHQPSVLGGSGSVLVARHENDDIVPGAGVPRRQVPQHGSDASGVRRDEVRGLQDAHVNPRGETIRYLADREMTDR